MIAVLQISLRAGVISLISLVALSACGLAGENLPDNRYQMVVEVDTPEGLRFGNSALGSRTFRGNKTTLNDRIIYDRDN